jgi:3-hydroxybutyryl-CoA dehydrogenase
MDRAPETTADPAASRPASPAGAVQERAVLVVGGGTMGAGIAQVLVSAGHRVSVSEVSSRLAEKAAARVREGLRRAGEEPAAGRLEVVVGVPGRFEGAALAIEAVVEDETSKRAVLADIERHVGERTLIASNTSSLSIAGLARALGRPERFLGMHFFNPVPRSALVELVVGPATSVDALDDAREWVRAIGKEEIVVRDSPGFATSRLGIAIGLEAIRMVEEGVASPEDIDRAMVLGYRFPMGPLRLTDLVGLDVRLAIAEHLASTLGDRYTPPKLLQDKVAAGELGKKTGKGFFLWT